MSTCGATAKSTGKPCQRPAGWGTEHVGRGRCKLHGGMTPVKHGRYSKVSRQRLRSLIESYEEDEDPLNVLPELAAARALFQDFVERYDEWRSALLAWHDSYSFTDNPKPRTVLDVSDAYRLLGSIAKIAQQEKKLQLDNAISRKDLLRIFSEQRRVIETEVSDQQLVDRLLKGFLSITLN